MFITIIRARLLHSLRYLLVLSILALPRVTASRCFGQENPPQTEQQRRAREALNKGVQDFKNGQYDEATQDFLNAKQLDLKLINARLYLATTYTSQYIPGAPSEENVQRGRQAAEEFRGVLALDPQNVSAIDGLRSILFQMGGQPFDPDLFAESKSLHQQHTLISGQGTPNPITGSASLTGRFRSARKACSGRSSTCPCAGGNRVTTHLFLQICKKNMRASMGESSMKELTRSITPLD